MSAWITALGFFVLVCILAEYMNRNNDDNTPSW